MKNKIDQYQIERFAIVSDSVIGKFKNLKYYAELSGDKELIDAAQEIDNGFINFKKILNEK